MEQLLNQHLNKHSFTYKQSLNRIIDKYSKFRHDEEYSDVDLNHVDLPTLEKCLSESKKMVCQLESESLTNLSEGSYGGGSAAQAATGHSQRQDSSHQDSDADESADSISQFSLGDTGMSSADATRLTDCSLDESRRNFSEVDVQPEDEDEELEMSLSRNGNFMAELYPGMISRLGAAWRRQHASEAADAVLKRYHRWRLQPRRVNLNKTVVVSTRPDGRKASGEKRSLSGPARETSHRSPLKMATGVHGRPPQSPGKARGSPSKARSRPILVMELDSSSDSEMEISLNETFTVSETSPAKRGRSPYAASSYYSPKKATAGPSPQFRTVSSPARLAHSAACSVCSPKAAAARARANVCGSPVRRSPSNVRVLSERSPPTFYRQHSHGEPVRPRSFSATLSSPSRWPAVRQCPQRSPRSLNLAPRSPQPTATSALSRLRRRLSLDSSLASIADSRSSQHLDAKIQLLYHRYVCQRKWMFPNAGPCQECRERSQARRVHSSSILSALALSPHCSNQRKRFREQGCGGGSTSKRLKEEYWPYSPGSERRERNQLLRRRLCPEEFEPRGGGGGGLRFSPGGAHGFSRQRHSSMTLH